MNYFQKQRHDFILSHAKQYGSINRKDLMDKFGISVPQASIDFKNFQEKNPNILEYDFSKKAYLYVEGGE